MIKQRKVKQSKIQISGTKQNIAKPNKTSKICFWAGKKSKNDPSHAIGGDGYHGRFAPSIASRPSIGRSEREGFLLDGGWFD